MKVRTLASVALGTSMILAIGGVLAMADSPMAVHATLSGYQEVPAISTTGEGDFKAEIGAHAIRYRLRFDHLEGGDVLFAQSISDVPRPTAVSWPSCAEVATRRSVPRRARSRGDHGRRRDRTGRARYRCG